MARTGRRWGRRSALVVTVLLALVGAAGAGGGLALLVGGRSEADEPPAAARLVDGTPSPTGVVDAAASSAPVGDAEPSGPSGPSGPSVTVTPQPAASSRTTTAPPTSRRPPTPVEVPGFDLRHPVVADGRFGPLRLGMSYAQAMRTGWIAKATWRPARPQPGTDCPDLYEDVHGLVTVQLSRTRGVQGFGLHRGVHTAQGLGVGSSWSRATRVLAPHGGVVIPADSPYAWGRDPDGKGDIMIVPDVAGPSLRNGKVFEIWLAGPGWCEP